MSRCHKPIATTVLLPHTNPIITLIIAVIMAGCFIKVMLIFLFPVSFKCSDKFSSYLAHVTITKFLKPYKNQHYDD